MRKAPLVALALATLSLAACRPDPPPPPPPPDGIVAIIHEAFGPLGEGDKAVRVAACESGLNPGAVSPGGTYQGLFQLHARVIAVHAYGAGHRLDPVANVYAARDLFVNRGWQPWPVCGRR